MVSVSLVVTDLDGTLWGADGTVHADTLAALADLERRTVPVLVATGRRRRSAEAGLAAAGLRPPAVLLDGALGYDLDTGQSFHHITYEPSLAAAALDVFRSHGLEPCVYVHDADVDALIGERPSTHPAHLAGLGDAARRADLQRAVREEPIVSFGIVAGEPATLAAVARDLDGIAAPVVTRDVVHGAVTLMVPPRGVSKWDGVVAFCARQGLDEDGVLAVGDGQNDVALLERAAVACAVSDGCDEVLELAHHVLPPARQGGWASVLDLL